MPIHLRGPFGPIFGPVNLVVFETHMEPEEKGMDQTGGRCFSTIQSSGFQVPC